MQDKKYKYIRYLVSVSAVTLLLVFLLEIGFNIANAEEEPLTILSSIQDDLKDDVDGPNQSVPVKESLLDVPDVGKCQSTLEFVLRLTGTVLAGNENIFAFIEEETTGRQNRYSVGESIKGAEILKIDKDSVVIEKDGKVFVLRVTGGTNSENAFSETHSENGPLFAGVSEELPFFEPIFSETPPVDENASIEELPPFEPITNSTGPPIDPDALYEDLPEFVPITSGTGPPIDPDALYEDLPEFVPITSGSGSPEAYNSQLENKVTPFSGEGWRRRVTHKKRH